MAGKKEVLAGLARTGQPRHTPLWLAPWEVRTLALCRRFGEPELSRQIKAQPDGKLGYLIRSIWRWPVWPTSRKVALMFWLLTVELAPTPLALHVARMHPRTAGLPVAEPA